MTDFRVGDEYYFCLPQWTNDDEFHIKVERADSYTIHVYYKSPSDEIYNTSSVSYAKRKLEEWFVQGYLRPLGMLPEELFEL